MGRKTKGAAARRLSPESDRSPETQEKNRNLPEAYSDGKKRGLRLATSQGPRPAQKEGEWLI